MFCRVCGFQARVWGSYGTSRSFGYGYGSVTELTKVPGGYKTCRTRNLGIVGRVAQNSHKFRVQILKSCRTSRTSGYGYCGTGGQNSQKFRVLWHGRAELTEFPCRYKNGVPVRRVLGALAYRTYRSSGYGYEYPTELTEVLGTGKTHVNTRPRGRSSI